MEFFIFLICVVASAIIFYQISIEENIKNRTKYEIVFLVIGLIITFIFSFINIKNSPYSLNGTEKLANLVTYPLFFVGLFFIHKIINKDNIKRSFGNYFGYFILFSTILFLIVVMILFSVAKADR